MNYPDAGAMQLLFAVYDRHALEIIGDDIWLCVPPDEARLFEGHFDIPASEKAVPTYAIPESATDALFLREWIEWEGHDGAKIGLRITDAGKYHLDRWLRGWLAEAEKDSPDRMTKGNFAGRIRWLKRATLPEMQAHYRIKTPEEWRRTAKESA